MAAQADPTGKGNPQGDRQRTLTERCLQWVERHPRTGWYIAFCATLNVILNLVQIFGS